MNLRSRVDRREDGPRKPNLMACATSLEIRRIEWKRPIRISYIPAVMNLADGFVPTG